MAKAWRKILTEIDIGATNGVAPLVHTHNGLAPQIPDIAVSTASTGWITLATIPSATIEKGGVVTIHAVTPSGTRFDATFMINIAHRTDNQGYIAPSIMANVAHSYNSWSGVENGWLFSSARIGFYNGNWYFQLNKLITPTMTISVKPNATLNWNWVSAISAIDATALTLVVSINMNRGLNANASEGIPYAQSSGYSTYSNYGVLGVLTYSSSTFDNTNKWQRLGYTEFKYNSSYLNGQFAMCDIKLKEYFEGNYGVGLNAQEFILRIKAKIGVHTDAATFNALVPDVSIEIEGNTTLTVNDIACVYYSSATTYKYLRFYIKTKRNFEAYEMLIQNRYGRMFSGTLSSTTLNGFVYQPNTSSDLPTTTLPTPVSGSVKYLDRVINTRDNIIYGTSNLVCGHNNFISGNNNTFYDANLILGHSNLSDSVNLIVGTSNDCSTGTENIVHGDENITESYVSQIFGKKNNLLPGMEYVRAFRSMYNSVYDTQQYQFNMALTQIERLDEGSSFTISVQHNTLNTSLSYPSYSVVGIKIKAVAMIMNATDDIIETCSFEVNGLCDLNKSVITFGATHDIISLTDTTYGNFASHINFNGAVTSVPSKFAIGIEINADNYAVALGLTNHTDLDHWHCMINLWVDTYTIGDGVLHNYARDVK